MNIVFCLDKNLLNSLKAIINSINYHTKRNVNYYVICPKDENRFFEDFINTNNLKNIKLGNFEPSDFILNLIKKCKYCFGSRISNYSRLNIKKVFPELKKIIYLDTDMIILDDIGKLWDSVNLDENNFFASPKYILFHKLFYIKRLQYYYQYFNQSNYFNGGVFVTDLTFWDDKLYQKLFEITDNFLENDICHTFTEAILNTLFSNFIQLDPSWNCSGYGNNKWYYILKLRDSNYKQKIIHWSGPTKPWYKKNIYKEKLWEYYLNLELGQQKENINVENNFWYLIIYHIILFPFIMIKRFRYIVFNLYFLFVSLISSVIKIILVLVNSVSTFLTIQRVKKFLDILIYVVLLKPFFILLYYTTNLKTRISITEKLYLAEGKYRKVYIHPLDNTKCIKINKESNIFWNENMMDYRYHLLNKKNTSTAKCYGTINTNLGIGLVFELVRDYDKNISRTLEYYNNNTSFFKNSERLIELNNKIITIKKDFANANDIKDFANANDISDCNMVVKKLNNDTFEIICIDGYFYIY